jgi:hypothetical protein
MARSRARRRTGEALRGLPLDDHVGVVRRDVGAYDLANDLGRASIWDAAEDLVRRVRKGMAQEVAMNQLDTTVVAQRLLQSRVKLFVELDGDQPVAAFRQLTGEDAATGAYLYYEIAIGYVRLGN